MCKDFINTEVSGNKGLTKVEKAMIAVRAKKALLENEILTLEQYTEEVFQDTKLIGKFNDYITTVQRNYPIGSVDLNRNHSSDVLV